MKLAKKKMFKSIGETDSKEDRISNKELKQKCAEWRKSLSRSTSYIYSRKKLDQKIQQIREETSQLTSSLDPSFR